MLCVPNHFTLRYRPLKPGAGSVQADLLAKLQHFDFALNDVDNAGCRWVGGQSDKGLADRGSQEGWSGTGAPVPDTR
jgi:hypothetical protein